MKTPVISVLLFLLAAVLGAVGQFLYESGADRATGGLVTFLVNGRILAGVQGYRAADPPHIRRQRIQ